MGTASDKSIWRLTKSLERHDVGDLGAAIREQIENGLDQRVASSLIALVEALPMTEAAQKAADAKVTEAGYYRHPVDGRTVKVQISRTSGYAYGMDMVGGKWKFISGLIHELDKSQRAPAPAQTNDQQALANLIAQVQARAV